MGVNEIGIVLVGLIAFFLGMAVTMFCYTLKNEDRTKRRHRKLND